MINDNNLKHPKISKYNMSANANTSSTEESKLSEKCIVKWFDVRMGFASTDKPHVNLVHHGNYSCQGASILFRRIC